MTAVTFYELQDDTTYETIGQVENGEIVSGKDELHAIGVEPFLDDVDSLLRVYDGPYIVAGEDKPEPEDTSKRTEKSVEMTVNAVFKEWVPFEGPQGGEGWQNTITGDKRYQETKPGGEGNNADISVPSGISSGQIKTVLTSLLGGAVVNSLIDQATGGSGGTISPQMLVSSAAMYIAQTGRSSLGELQERLTEAAEEEQDPYDLESVEIEAPNAEHSVEITTQTSVPDVSSTISDQAGDRVLTQIASEMSEEASAEDWTQAYLGRIGDNEELVAEFQDKLDERIRERSVSIDSERSSVVVPRDVSPEDVREAAQSVLGEQRYELMAEMIETNPSVDESDPDTWIKGTLNWVGDDAERVSTFQDQFDVSAAGRESESEEGESVEVGSDGIDTTIVVPDDVETSDVKNAIQESLGSDAVSVLESFMEHYDEESADDPHTWVENTMEMIALENPEGADGVIENFRESLLEDHIDTDDSDDERREAFQRIADYDHEGEWQAYQNPTIQLIRDGVDGSEIAEALEEEAGLEPEQVVNIAWESYDQIGERNAPNMTETTDNPSLTMDYGNEFPAAVEERVAAHFGNDAYEMMESIAGEWWDEGRFSRDRAAMWQLAAEQTGNSNIPEDDGQLLEADVSAEEREVMEAYKSHVHGALQELYGDSVPVYRAINDEDLVNRIQEAREADGNESIEFDHRPLESWSSDLKETSLTSGEDGVVVRREVPVEDVWASSLTGFRDAHRNEFLIQSEGDVEYSGDDVLAGSEVYDGGKSMDQVSWAADIIDETAPGDGGEDDG